MPMNSDAKPTPNVDHWKYFEDRATALKEAMFKTVTWIMGFAAVLFGFAVKEGFEGGLTSA
jgi:hypothetical protein